MERINATTGSYNFIDLFAGAGGLSEGFIQAGFSPVAHVEMNPYAAQTLETRTGYYYLKAQGKLDIYKDYISGKITRDEFLQHIPEEQLQSVFCETMSDETLPRLFENIDKILTQRGIKQVDVIIGGPPCQAYSLVGRAQSKHMETPMSADPRNDLYKLYARFLQKYQPKMFVFENVMGIKSANGGATWLKVQEALRSVGYEIECHEQNSKNFGVLQNRRRMIIVGWLKNSGLFYPQFEKKIADATTVNDILSDLPAVQPGGKSGEYRTDNFSDYLRRTGIRKDSDILTHHCARPNKDRDIEIYRRTIELWNDGHKRLNYNDLPDELKTHKNRKSFLDRFKVVEGDEAYCHTMLAHISKDGHYFIHPDIEQHRSITVREAARIQSFPDDYFFEGPRTAQFVQIGNARHNRTEELPTSTLRSIKPFLPPELIIQDELHLITGPLGTVYGAYETVIEDLCSYTIGEKKIKPKYVVSTATIKNAAEQTKCLYGRKVTAQFPPNGFEIGDSFYIREVPVEQDPFRRYLGVCAPGQSVKTALLRVYSIILQSAYNLSLDDEYKDVIDPYYTLVGYYNSIRELGGAVRLLQDDIPDRIQRIKKKYGMSRQRFLNHKVEITSRMSSYDIPKKLSQLETPYTDRNCLDTAIATNMIAVGMDVDRLGLMVVTGQPKQNSEYIQATSRIGRSYPGLVVTLYNPYRPRDLSHYENFTGYHAQLYRFVEGTTATPFSARARDRVLHALVISAIRLHYPEFASNDGAAAIDKLTDEQLNEVKALIMNRLNIIKPSAKADAEHEIDDFISNWKLLATQSKELRYYVYTTKTYNRLMNTYGEVCTDLEKPTLRSMRDVERAANMFYYTED